MSGVDDFPDDVTALARAVGVYRDSPEPGDGTASDEPVPYSLTDLAVIALEPGWAATLAAIDDLPELTDPKG